MFKLLSIDIASSLFSLLRYFGHLSDISIKIFRNSTHYFIFSDIMTELTLIRFCHSKKISVYDRKMTKHNLASSSSSSRWRKCRPTFAIELGSCKVLTDMSCRVI